MNLNELGIVVAAIGVVIGVVLEGWEQWNDFKTKGWKPVTPKVGFAILVASLAVGIVFDARIAKESADTKLEAARIEKEYGPRKLTRAQFVAFISGAKPFAGEQVIFNVGPNDVESAAFSGQIGKALILAGWTASGGIMQTWGMRSGLTLQSTQDKKSREGAAFLASELRRDGFPVPPPTAEADTPQFGHRTGKIWVFVNPRPVQFDP